MSSKFLNAILAATLISASTCATALPFSSFDTRSMAMGGAGVAVSGPDAAPLFNPALLSASKEEDDFGLILPTIGIRISDPEKLRDSIDKFQSGNYVNNLQIAVNGLNTALSAANLASIQTNAAVVSTNLNGVSTQLVALSNKPIAIDGGIATVVGIPSKKFGVAFYANGSVATGGIFQYRDGTTLQTLSSQAACLAVALTLADVNTCNTTYGSTFNFTSTTLQSGINFKGVILGEFGFALSREFSISDHSIALGITPKIIKTQLFDADIRVNDSNQTNFNGADFIAEYNLINFDLGAAKNYNNGWRSGIVIKNIIPQKQDFKRAPTLGVGATPVATGSKLSLMPQARVGVSHSNNWSTVALDVDLTRNDPAGFENATQYVALGGELDAFGWAQVRAGYRIDIVDNARNVTSLGLGFSPFGIHADFAVAGNANEIGASFQLGFHF